MAESHVLENILQKMPEINKPQQKFIRTLILTLMLFRGEANYRNLSRYSDIFEKTFSRWFRRSFDFMKFNSLAIKEYLPEQNVLLAALDCSFVPKSGKHTYGLDLFYNGKHDKAEKGLEISTLAVVDGTYNTAYNLSTRQTPVLEKEVKTRIDWYLEHFKTDCKLLPKSIRYLLTDGYYSKNKFTSGLLKLGYHQVGKLRCDANLRYLYDGPQKPGFGRKKRYDGKVKFVDECRLKQIKVDDELNIYTQIVNSVSLKCDIRIAYLVKKVGKKMATALLFSTDTNLSALEIYQYYKSRFQIEFLFRDAKQFTGLTQCRAQSEQALHFHFNVTMTALNFIKFNDRLQAKNQGRKPISISSWKTRYFNEHLLERFSRMLGFELSSIKSEHEYESLRNYGVVAM
jgi:hypothetical protein